MSYGRLGWGSAPKVYLLATLAGIIMGVAAGFLQGDTSTYISYAIPQVCYLGAMAIYLRYKNIKISAAIPFRKPINPISLIMTLAVTIGLFGQNLILAVAFQWLVQAVGISASVPLPGFGSPLSFILGIAIICILPALGEESLFRGLTLKSLDSKGAVKAVLLSAALFSLSHGNIVQLVHQFILGVFLAYLTIKTGNIIFAMLIHFFNNLLAITLPIVLPSYNNLAVCSLNSTLIMLGMSLIGMLILYPSLRLLIKKAGGNPDFISFFAKGGTKLCYNNDKQDANSNNCATANAINAKGGKDYIGKSGGGNIDFFSNNIDGSTSCDNDSGKIWLVGWFAFLIVQLVINTAILFIPSVKALLA